MFNGTLRSWFPCRVERKTGAEKAVAPRLTNAHRSSRSFYVLQRDCTTLRIAHASWGAAPPSASPLSTSTAKVCARAGACNARCSQMACPTVGIMCPDSACSLVPLVRASHRGNVQLKFHFLLFNSRKAPKRIIAGIRLTLGEYELDCVFENWLRSFFFFYVLVVYCLVNCFGKFL